MNRTALCALSAALFCVAGSASAQTAQEYQYPSTAGSLSPPSTLRMTVTPEPGAAPAPPPVRDSPQSLQLYTQCRDEADRAAVNAAKMRDAVAQCLDDLAQRRANGQ